MALFAVFDVISHLTDSVEEGLDFFINAILTYIEHLADLTLGQRADSNP